MITKSHYCKKTFCRKALTSPYWLHKFYLPVMSRQWNHSDLGNMICNYEWLKLRRSQTRNKTSVCANIINNGTQRLANLQQHRPELSWFPTLCWNLVPKPCLSFHQLNKSMYPKVKSINTFIWSYIEFSAWHFPSLSSETILQDYIVRTTIQ